MSIKSGCDPRCPAELKTLQAWFASVITRPLNEEDKVQSLSPTGQPLEEEAKHFIVRSAKLQPHQRIQIYNQQYWWRLLSTLHEIFPLLTRLFGYYDFNRMIGVPYLQTYPPSHWSLNCLGNKMPTWVEKHYLSNDKNLILDIARVEVAYNSLFLAALKPPLNQPSPEQLEKLMTTPLTLQPYIALFNFNYHLFQFRNEMISEGDGDGWLEKDFPEIQQGRVFYFVLFRNQNSQMTWEEISYSEHLLLSFFRAGSTLENACDELERSSHAERAVQDISGWFRKWAERKWLILK